MAVSKITSEISDAIAIRVTEGRDIDAIGKTCLVPMQWGQFDFWVFSWLATQSEAQAKAQN